ncbi:uncharacterized protein LOC121601214 isoform X2 [Anopheles merus]|uniref:uncharacterized protein LOC121601214 isoform X2 n=1 Tax=Anopheles merus TaxID=30066 RepID=UPI001BE41CB7|nr:uncharacterized protein LOC121601214 isoform X2 [Anopheles merus]
MDTEHWPLQPFNDIADASDLRREWEEWHRAFELIVTLKKIETQSEKLAYMLARGGRGLQRIYFNLAAVPGEQHPRAVSIPFKQLPVPEYDNAIKRLNHFFLGKRNERIELEVFRSLKQENEESVNQYVLRLRAQASRCDFQDRVTKEILHQITIGAKDERVRDKGLEDIMELDELINYAINREVLISQKMKIKDKEIEPSIAYVKQQPMITKRKWQDTSCHRCGSWRHNGNSNECYARKARCNACGRIGHFGRCCKTEGENVTKNRFQWKKPKTESSGHMQRNQRRNSDAVDNLNERLTTSRLWENGMVTCTLDHVPVEFLIDSGASVNTVTEEVWKTLQEFKADIHDITYDCNKNITAYASKQPIKIILKFKSLVTVNENKPTVYAEFFVVQNSNKSLLGKTTAEQLKVLKVGLEVQNLEEKIQPFPKFPNIQIRLSINKAIPPKKKIVY